MRHINIRTYYKYCFNLVRHVIGLYSPHQLPLFLRLLLNSLLLLHLRAPCPLAKTWSIKSMNTPPRLEWPNFDSIVSTRSGDVANVRADANIIYRFFDPAGDMYGDNLQLTCPISCEVSGTDALNK